MKKLGIIGGMGPLATAFFYRKVVEKTPAERDQQHIETIIVSDPIIPGRVDYILGRSADSPVPSIRRIVCTLENAGAERIVMPCVTAHYFYSEICEGFSVRIVNLLSEIGDYFAEKKIRRAGVLATSATIRSNVLQNDPGLNGTELLFPDEREMEETDRIIFRQIKAGKVADTKTLQGIADHLVRRGAEQILVACTDLSVLSPSEWMNGPVTDVLDILAEAAVRECLK